MARTRGDFEGFLMSNSHSHHHDDHDKDEGLARYMAQHGLKSTRQRSLIIDTFFAVGGHLSVEELWNKVREQDTKVSVATVYRTMKLLSECGLAHARNFGDGQTRYEAAAGRDHHDHLVCTRCGTIIEFENERIEALQDAVARKHGFKVTSHKMELYGLCRDCQRAGSAASEA
ncbi:transcriptional regulator, Fur family [Myxococcus xanthus DK 1622]|uniref:Ferric uptake regulation protein n=2 Tax=Myxococcaceae TaxID=31 RepID=Q1D635_MYXXD|nr:transcriptional regulator, Fur family [Myxococcus xanthus DK 1622]